MIAVLRNGTYRALFFAQVVSLLGTGLLTVALGLLAFDIAGDRAGSILGTALTIKMVAYVGIAPLMAALVDRLPKKAVLIGADLVRLGIALLLPLVTETWQIYLLVFVLQSASATFTPAFQSLIPSVLPDSREYSRALALSRLAYDLEALLSPAIAAALLTVVTFHNLFVGTAIGFALSALLVAIARLPARTATASNGTFWQRLPAGVRAFVATPSLRFVMLANVVVAAATALVLVNSVVYARTVFDLDDAALAVALACFGVGSLVVAIAVPRLLDRWAVASVMIVGAVLAGAGLVAASAVTALVVAGGTIPVAGSAGWLLILAVWVVLGMGTSLINTPLARLLADASTEGNRHLVFTAQFALSHACFLLTYPIAGWLGAVDLFAAAVALTTIAAAALATILLFRRRFFPRDDVIDDRAGARTPEATPAPPSRPASR